MTDLKNKINEDINFAMKSGSNDIVDALRFLMSAIKNKELEKRSRLSKEIKQSDELLRLSELADEEVVAVIISEIKKIKESISQYEGGGRKDLAEREKKGLEILKKYVPEEMSGEELRSVVKKKIAEFGGATVKDFGKIMGFVMSDMKGRAGGDMVKKVIEEELKNES